MSIVGYVLMSSNFTMAKPRKHWMCETCYLKKNCDLEIKRKFISYLVVYYYTIILF